MVKIIADYREKSSGVPEMLIRKNAEVSFESLAVGDYIINGQITAERKTAEDFVQSIIVNRLFDQCSRLKKTHERVFLFIEGNPYTTNHKIDKEAVRGAVLSIMVAWQIPVIYSKSADDSTALLMRIGAQSLKENVFVRMTGTYKPRKIKSHQLRFIQGLPCTGPTLASRLFNHFGNIKSMVNASTKDLRKIKGIGKKSANRIAEFVTSDFCHSNREK